MYINILKYFKAYFRKDDEEMIGIINDFPLDAY